MAHPLEFPQQASPDESMGPKRRVAAVKPDDPAYQQYFEHYSSLPIGQEAVSNVVATNPDGVFLFRTSEDGKEKLNHVVWIYTAHRDPENHDPFAFQLPVYTNISKNDWKEFQADPKLLDRANAILMKCFNEAMNFYPWKSTDTPRGLVMEGSKGFGFEGGNFLGIRGSIEEVRPLIAALRENDSVAIAKYQKHLTAVMVHEFTHNERDDGMMSVVDNEIASHIAQFIVDPHKNEIFDQQLSFALNRIEENRTQSDPQKPLSLYDKAQYFALLHITGGLAQRNTALRTTLQSDPDPHKLKTLRSLSVFIQPSDQEYLHRDFLPQIMKTRNEKLMQEAHDLETEHGITRSILEIK